MTKSNNGGGLTVSMAMFRVITEYRCPCEECAGDLVCDPDIEEFSSLREALDAFARGPGPDQGEDREYSSWPGPRPGDWISITGTAWEAPYSPGYVACEYEEAGGSMAYSRSLHIDRTAPISPASRMRILRLAMEA